MVMTFSTLTSKVHATLEESIPFNTTIIHFFFFLKIPEDLRG